MINTNRGYENIKDKEGDNIGRILLIEFNGQDTLAFDEVIEVLNRDC